MAARELHGTLTKPAPSPRTMALAAIAFTLLFLAFPEIDRFASGLLYRESGFVLKGNAVFTFVHDYIGVLAWLVALMALLSMVTSFFLDRLKPIRPVAAYGLLLLLLGPGLVVNVLFKDQWGRARPGQTVEFGGTQQFTPAWVVSDQCRKNCSFVCGDASIGFSLVGAAFVSRRPRPWFHASLGFGGALGLMRMAQGGHFLSDVIFSFLAVWFTAWALSRVFARLGWPLAPPG